VQAIHFFIARSVCLLSSNLCTMRKPFDKFRCHLAGRLVGSNDTVLVGVPDPKGNWKFWVEPPAETRNCKLPSGEYKRGAIPPFPKLLWSWFSW